MRTLGDPEAGDGEQRGQLAKAYTDFLKPAP